MIACSYPPSLTQYVYLFAPISFLVINPIMFVLMELGTATPAAARRSKSAIARHVLRNVITSPPVAATLVGLVVNLASGGQTNGYVSQPLALLGDAFSCLALLALGASIVGRLHVLQVRDCVSWHG